MSWFYSAPLYLSLPIFLIGFVAGSLALVFALRPWVRSAAAQPKEWDRVLGYSIGTFGVFFGIFLALVAVAAYQNYVDVHTDVLQESSALGAVYRDVSGFPATVAAPLQERSARMHVPSSPRTGRCRVRVSRRPTARPLC